MYDPAIGRWWQVDPFSNAYYSYSPYSYVTNNPVIYIDENGQFKIPIHRRIIQNALSRLGFSKRWFRIDLLAGNTIIADIFGAGEDIHFDGRKNFTEVNNTWNSLNSEIKKASLGNTTWGGAHTQHFGKLLHNVQDFYAHSNYIEIIH